MKSMKKSGTAVTQTKNKDFLGNTSELTNNSTVTVSTVIDSPSVVGFNPLMLNSLNCYTAWSTRITEYQKSKPGG